MLPDLILQTLVLDGIDSYDSLPICVHRAMNVSRVAFAHKWELLVVIFATINASIKIFLYMITSNQFRWTVLYCLNKPFEKPETQPPTKSVFAENFRKRIESLSRRNSSYNIANGNDPHSTPPGGYYQNYRSQPSHPNEYYHGNSHQAQRPYVITASSSSQVGPPGVVGVRYYEDQYGSRRMLATGAAGQPSVPHPPSKTTLPRDCRDSSTGRPLTVLPPYPGPAPRPPDTPPITLNPVREPKLKWREDKLEPFPRTSAQGVTITGGPWDDDVMEMVI